MGPITLFDKSFLQSLTLDESVWFDNFFRANVCPLFYIETLADLNKSVRKGRYPEQEVRIIADKFPQMNSLPNLHHAQLGIADLLGHQISMAGQVMVPRFHLAQTPDSVTTIVETSPEADAFMRWQKEEFSEIEGLYARQWREWLSSLNLKQVAEEFRKKGLDRKKVKRLEDAKTFAEEFAAIPRDISEFMELARLLLGFPTDYNDLILQQWNRTGRPPMTGYAPYATYLLKVQVFFYIVLAASLIRRPERKSNQVDVFYLYYLPFCTIFVSSDTLHRDCAPLFLREDQEFVWGGNLKNGLKRLNEFYLRLPEETRNQGVMRFAIDPPKEGDFFVSQLWDRHVPGWRQREEFSPAQQASYASYIMRKLEDLDNVSAPATSHYQLEPNKADSLVIKRPAKTRKGSWWQTPKNLKFPVKQ